MPLCVICNKPTGCTCQGNWRNIACSYDHYIQFINKYEGVSGKVPYKLRCSDGRVMWDIKDYVIRNDDIEFITTMEGKTLGLSETEYLIILNDEKKNLLKSYIDNGEYIRIDKKDYHDVLKLSFGSATPIVEAEAEIVSNEQHLSDNAISSTNVEALTENIDKESENAEGIIVEEATEQQFETRRSRRSKYNQ